MKDNKIKNKEKDTHQNVDQLVDQYKQLKKENELLINETKRLNNIVNATEIGTWEWEINTGKVNFNEKWAEMIGYSLEELMPTDISVWKRICHPDDYKKSSELLDRVFNNEISNYEIEVRVKHKDGHWVWILDKGEVITWDPQGKPVFAVGSHTDISKIKKVTQEIENVNEEYKKSKILLQSYLDSAKDMIILSIDTNYNYLYFNELHATVIADIYGIEIKIGDNILDCITIESDRKKAKKNYELALSGTFHTIIEEYGYENKKYFESFFNPIFNDHNEVIGATAFAKDITEKINYENQLKENAYKLKTILNSTNEGIYGVDLYGSCTMVNQSLLTMLGYDDEDELIGKNMHELIHHHHENGTFFPKEKCKVEMATISEKKGTIGEDTLWKKNGELIHISFSSNPLIEDSKITGAVVSIKDETEHIKAKKALEKANKFSQEYLDIAGVMIIVLDAEGIVTVVNKKGAEIIGLEQKEILGKNWVENFIPEIHRNDIKNIIKGSFRTQDQLPEFNENSLLTADKKERIIQWSNTFLYDESDKFVGVLSSGKDVTEIKLANEKLKISEQRFRELFENAPFGYQSLDENGNFIEVNNKWLELLGYKREEVIGKWFGDFLIDDYKSAFKNRFEVFKKAGSIYSEFPMKTRDGKTVQVGFDGKIGYQDNKKFKQTHCTVTDITEISMINDKLKDSERKHRELISQMPLGLVSHEIILNDEGIPIDYKFISCNAKYEEQINKQSEDFIGKTVLEVFPKTEAYWIETYGKVALTGISTVFESYSKELEKYYKVTAYSLGYKEFALIVEDISDQKRKEYEIIYLSRHDYLTNLHNRFSFVNEFKNLDHQSFYPLGVLMIDVNGLKIINDAYGHAKGDGALTKVAAILMDTFGENDIVARIGGDEFGVIVPNTSIEELEEYKVIIRSKLNKDMIDNIVLSVAIGYEIKTNESSENLDEILKKAENFMYRHKLAEGISVRNHAIKAILQTLTEKYEEERIHSEKVSQLCKKMGEAMKLSEEDLKELELAGMYHDIGKISIPDAILNKPGRLTEEEYAIIKTHPEISYQILRAADEYSDLAVHALYHHERYDGKGYPTGLKGNEIPLFSKIISIADSFEAMTADRVYKDKMTQEQAVEEIIRCAGSQFDPKIAKIFVEKVLHAIWIK